jgi:hypothetical protein
MRSGSAVLVFTVALSTSIIATAQTAVTCHVQTFQAPAGATVSNPLHATAINRYRNIVGTDGSGKPFVRWEFGRIERLHIDVVNASTFDVAKRNASGVTVGTVQTVDSNHVAGVHGFANSGSTTRLIDIPNANTQVTGINRYGTIVGNYFTFTGPGGNGSFVLKNGTVRKLQVPTQFARNTEVTAISDTGVIVGNYALQNSAPDPDEAVHGFVLINGQYQDLAYPDASENMFVKDINGTGMIVGQLDGPSTQNSFIYKGGKFYAPKFVLPDGSVASRGFIFGVNGYGQITGTVLVSGTSSSFIGSCGL